MKKITILLMCLCAGSAWAQRQVEDDAGWAFKDRIYFGGGLGINGGRDFFGNRYFFVNVSPIVGYMVTPRFSAGTAFDYTHLRYSDFNVSTNQYGVSPFLRYNIQQFFVMTEYNFINVEVNPFNDDRQRQVFNRWLAGLGISQPVGNRGAINMVAMYDLLYENTGPFASPWVFRVFFSF